MATNDVPCTLSISSIHILLILAGKIPFKSQLFGIKMFLVLHNYDLNLPSLLLLCLSPSTCYARWRNRLVTIQGPLPYGANNCGGCQPSAQLVAEGNCTIPRGQQHCPCHIHRPCGYSGRDMASLGTEHRYVSPTSSMHGIPRPRAPWPPSTQLVAEGNCAIPRGQQHCPCHVHRPLRILCP